jgi:hypothetical protein
VIEADRSRFAALVLERLEAIELVLKRLERRLAELGDEIDALDRGLRPFGDGSKLRRPRRG